MALACTGSDAVDGVDGLQGVPGPRGPQGEPGPVGPAAFHWVDATGKQVSEAEALGIFDDVGLWWDVDDELAVVVLPAVEVGYESDNCTGDAWVWDVKPRRPFAIGEFGPLEPRVRGDTVESELACFSSYKTELGVCAVAATCEVRAVPLVDTEPDAPIAWPTTDWTPPLHMAPI